MTDDLKAIVIGGFLLASAEYRDLQVPRLLGGTVLLIVGGLLVAGA